MAGWLQATVPDHYAMAELSVAVNQGTLSLLQDETRPVGRLILDVSMQVHTLTTPQNSSRQSRKSHILCSLG